MVAVDAGHLCYNQSFEHIWETTDELDYELDSSDEIDKYIVKGYGFPRNFKIENIGEIKEN